MELVSKEFIDAINSKSFDRQFKAFAKHQVLNMKYFYSTEEGKNIMRHGSGRIRAFKDNTKSK